MLSTSSVLAQDAESCEGNLDFDQAVDGEDLTEFLYDFGRTYCPLTCTNSTPCPGDIDCDGDVDGSDMTTFLEDFGRGQYDRPCPICDGSPWWNNLNAVWPVRDPL